MPSDFDLQALIALENKRPVDDFLGLTANEMYHLLHNTLSQDSPVRLRDDIDDRTLDRIPVFRVAEELMKILQREGQIKLTPLGALPKKFLAEVYAKGHLKEELVEEGLYKVSNEQYFPGILSARLAAQLAGLVKKSNGRLSLTRKASKLIEAGNRKQMFGHFLEAYTKKFNWGFNDGYPQEPITQMGWAFSLIMLHKFGDQLRACDFYAEKYLKAFPVLLAHYPQHYFSPEKNAKRSYELRVFVRFFHWFGLVKMENNGKMFFSDSQRCTKTELVNQLFIIEAG